MSADDIKGVYVGHVLGVDNSLGPFYILWCIAFALGWGLIFLAASELEVKFAVIVLRLVYCYRSSWDSLD